MSLNDEVLHRTREAFERLGRMDRELAESGVAPRRGDLYVFKETAEHDVRWAVLDRHPRDPERYLVVPADLERQVGSTDVAVPPTAPCGALTLRCGFGVWLAGDDFNPDLRIGFLAAGDLERARHKVARIEQGALTGSALERETDEETGYLDRAEELVLAQAALENAFPAHWPGGIDAVTGEDLLAPFDAVRAAAWARDEIDDPALLRLLEHVHHATRPHLGLPAGVDPADLRRAGWGIVLHADAPPELREALGPLIEHRRRQAGTVKILDYRPGEDWRDWLARQGVSVGEVEPGKVPYYLLIAGEPTRIPFDVQSVLGLQYAVGRLSFPALEDYRRYAESVVTAETLGEPPRRRRTLVFAPCHPGDPFTRLTADGLAVPLAEAAARRGFTPTVLRGAEATRSRFAAALRGEPGDVVVAAAHGLGWPREHADQAAAQGALLCQDWPGSGPPAREHYFAADDLPDDACLHGSIVVLLASYGAGTPRRDAALSAEPDLAAEPFVARLPQRLLTHPRGGALAVVGLVDRLWGHTLAAAEARQPFMDVLGGLLDGRPVGHALQAFNQRWATLSFDLNELLRKMGLGGRVPERRVATAWVERNHVRGWVVLGDPAARLRVENSEARARRASSP